MVEKGYPLDYLNVEYNIEEANKKINDISNLISQILEFNEKTKVGIIGMTGTVIDESLDENGKLVIGSKDEAYVEGKESDSEIVIKPTNDLNSITNAIKNMNSSKTAYRINLHWPIKAFQIILTRF